MDSLKAIIFDVSGTLLNDIHVVWKANSDAYEAVGLDGFQTLEEFREKFKMPVPDFHRENGVPEHLVETVDLAFRQAYPKYADRVSIFPEVIDVLDALKRKQMLLGVASNIPSRFLREHLGEFGIDGYFDAVVGQEDAEAQKPSPAPILAALKKLGVLPHEAMYVGDMEEDLRAAKAAETRVAAIVRDEGYHPLHRLQKHDPHYLITDLRELLPD